jgi:hypothetical protein
MKTIYGSFSVLFAMLTLGSSAALAESLKPALVLQPTENVFAPLGFDDNDNVQLVLYGNLSDTCHKAGPVKTRIDREAKTIYISNHSYYYTGCWCADVLVPFTSTVNLGIVAAGNYNVVLEKEDGGFEKMAELPITIARSNSPDDYLYAPVDHVQFNAKQGAREITISGTFQSSCMTLNNVKVTYRPNHVIEILPIADMAESGCRPEARPFESTIKVRDDVHGRALIHVRSLNGQSINRVVEL